MRKEDSKPLRAGCSREFLQQLFTFGPKAVVYVSCNPATQMRDLVHFTTAGYRLTAVQPFDLFPHTRHLECVMTLVMMSTVLRLSNHPRWSSYTGLASAALLAGFITFVAPLLVTAMAGPLLKERVGAGRWTAIVIGFAGVMVVLRPSGEGVLIPEETPIAVPLPATAPLLQDVVITGADRHMVGQVASSIKLYKPVEPYNGKGVRVEGEFVRRKEGKKTA